MLHYYKDSEGALHCVSGELDITDQKIARAAIRSVTGITPSGAVLTLVVDNPKHESEGAA